MKISVKVIPLSLFLLSNTLLGCDQKAVDDLAVTKPPTSSASVKRYYISDASGSDANTGLSMSAPFKTINAGQNAALPGDTVFVMNGTYVPATTIQLLKSGTADKYITYKAYPGQTPKFSFSGSIWNAVSINASYVVLEGIEFQGNNQNLTYAGAFASYTDKQAGGTNNDLYATYNMNGISIGGPRTDSKFPHHVVIRNCKIHDFPGGGLSAIQADYVTFEGNTINNNAWYMMYGGSGISILTPSTAMPIPAIKTLSGIISAPTTRQPFPGLVLRPPGFRMATELLSTLTCVPMVQRIPTSPTKGEHWWRTTSVSITEGQAFMPLRPPMSTSLITRPITMLR